MTGGVHPAGRARLWGESWYFDFSSADGSAGGFVRVGDYPRLGRRWFWAYVTAGARSGGCTAERPLPDGRDVPWRAEGPDLTFLVERAGGGWRIAADGAGIGIDLVWRERAEAYPYRSGERLEQPGWAVGEVRAGGTSYPVDGPGQRDQSWGIRDWGRFGWTWCSGWLTDGTRYQATLLDARGRIPPDGYLTEPGRPPEPVREVELHPDGIRMNDLRLRFADAGTVTVALPASAGGPSRLHRAMTVVRADGGRAGIGWRERNVPGPVAD